MNREENVQNFRTFTVIAPVVMYIVILFMHVEMYILLCLCKDKFEHKLLEDKSVLFLLFICCSGFSCS